MPEYEFYDENGDYATALMSSEEVPSIGDTIEHEGRMLTRIASRATITNANGFKPFTAFSQPAGDPDASKHGEGGHPRFDTKRDLNEYLDKRNSKGRSLEWNGRR